MEDVLPDVKKFKFKCHDRRESIYPLQFSNAISYAIKEADKAGNRLRQSLERNRDTVRELVIFEAGLFFPWSRTDDDKNLL